MNGLYDSLGRRIHYLRVAVTDRCNFRCQYCMPSDGVQWIEHNDILRYEELLRIINTFVRLGVDKVRITGGEPLVRKGLIPFLCKVAEIPGIEEIVLTTNGSMLEEYAPLLKQAGVKRINVSLDTLQAQRFKQITGQDALHQVVAGIKKAQSIGLTPIKINMVVMKGFNTDELADFAHLAMSNPYQVRFIEYMPFCSDKRYLFTASEMRQQLVAAGFTNLIPEMRNNSPAQIYRFPQSQGSIGFITPVSQHFCSSCNRIRLTSDGNLKPCLLSNQEYSLRELLRGGITDQELSYILQQVIWNKPIQHNLENGEKSDRGMYRIGG